MTRNNISAPCCLLILVYSQQKTRHSLNDFGEVQGTEAAFHLRTESQTGPFLRHHNVRCKISNSNCTYGNYIIRLYNIPLTNKIPFLNYIILQEWWENNKY